MIFKEICLILKDSEFLEEIQAEPKEFQGIDQGTFKIPFFKTIKGN